MRNTVTWASHLEDALIDIWIYTKNRQAVADASDQVDAFLRAAPEKGENHGRLL